MENQCFPAVAADGGMPRPSVCPDNEKRHLSSGRRAESLHPRGPALAPVPAPRTRKAPARVAPGLAERSRTAVRADVRGRSMSAAGMTKAAGIASRRPAWYYLNYDDESGFLSAAAARLLDRAPHRRVLLMHRSPPPRRVHGRPLDVRNHGGHRRTPLNRPARAGPGSGGAAPLLLRPRSRPAWATPRAAVRPWAAPGAARSSTRASPVSGGR